MRIRSTGMIALVLGAVSCGQDPSFIDLDKGTSASSIGQGSRDLDAQGDNGDGDDEGKSIDDFGKGGGGVLGDVIGDGASTDPKSGTTGGTTDNPSDDDDTMNDNPTDVDIPDVDEDELDALHKCLAKWGSVPFNGTTNVRKIYASVTVGGMGNAINDTEATADPELVLITAAVNVGGAPVYQLLNPNGYYCIKVNVNVLTNLNINLHCNARLADSKVGVNVGSVMNDNTSTVGVHVGSQVSVNTVRPSGQECIR